MCVCVRCARMAAVAYIFHNSFDWYGTRGLFTSRNLIFSLCRLSFFFNRMEMDRILLWNVDVVVVVFTFGFGHFFAGADIFLATLALAAER